MADLQKFKDHFILLCEAGFIAVNQADEDANNRANHTKQCLGSLTYANQYYVYPYVPAFFQQPGSAQEGNE